MIFSISAQLFLCSICNFAFGVKVQLQHKIKQESEQFRLWKASREKEVLQVVECCNQV